MAITTWISEHEKPSLSQVDDEELNELFQEVRKKFPGKFLIQTTRYDRRNWLDKLMGSWIKTGKLYTLYYMLDHIDAQVINFPPQEGTWSINTAVPKSYIMTYFFGLLNNQPNEK